MKALNIIGIVFSVLLIGVAGYYIDEVSSARYLSYYSDYSYGSSSSSITEEGGVTTMIFFLFFVFLFIMNMVKVKTTSSKVFSIIGLSLTVLAMAWDGLMISSPSHISYDEVGPAWIIYGLITLAFTIVHLVQSVKYGRKLKQPQSDTILDDGEIV